MGESTQGVEGERSRCGSGVPLASVGAGGGGAVCARGGALFAAHGCAEVAAWKVCVRPE